MEGEKNESLSETDKENPEKREDKSQAIKDVDLDHVELRYQKRIRDMLRKYAHMWDGSLGEISTAEHRIDLTPEAKPVRSAPYRAGPKARRAEREEVERMLRAEFIEPHNQNGRHQCSLCRNRMAPCAFAWTTGA